MKKRAASLARAHRRFRAVDGSAAFRRVEQAATGRSSTRRTMAQISSGPTLRHPRRSARTARTILRPRSRRIRRGQRAGEVTRGDHSRLGREAGARSRWVAVHLLFGGAGREHIQEIHCTLQYIDPRSGSNETHSHELTVPTSPSRSLRRMSRSWSGRSAASRVKRSSSARSRSCGSSSLLTRSDFEFHVFDYATVEALGGCSVG